MLEEINIVSFKKNTFDITKAWNALRDSIVFKDPAKYLEKLRDSGLFPADFIESLFYHKPEQVEFTPYLASEEERAKNSGLSAIASMGKKSILTRPVIS